MNGITATQKALNLQAINHYLTRETEAAYVADELDRIIFDFIYLFGEAGENSALAVKSVACNIYTLTQLRNLFIKTSLVNGECLEMQRFIDDFED
jgi:hypothetical protein